MEPSNATSPAEQTINFDGRRFRDVLGHLPSGVVAITGVDGDGGPIGTIVGTFTSVSLEPALVAFFIDKTSTTFPRLRDSGAFCANILSARQEPLCRKLSARGADKFDLVSWSPAPSGSPILEETVAWVDCDIDSVVEAGDHQLVIGRVRSLGVSNPTIPLLFFQGGFGGFAPMALAVDAQGIFVETLRSVDAVRTGMESLARDLEVDCLAHAVHGTNTTVVAAAYAPHRTRTTTRVGHQLPLVPPWAEPFLAWASDDDREQWLAGLRADTKKTYDADQVERNIAEIRDTGWAFTVRVAIDDDDRALEDLVRFGYTPAVERGLIDLIRRRGEHGSPAAFDHLPVGAVRNLCAPVLDEHGHLSLILALHNLPSDLTAKEARTYLDRLLEVARTQTPAGSASTDERTDD